MLAEELSALEQVEKQSRMHVGEAVRAAEEARAARDEASDAERACAASIEALREVERASAKAQGPALEWLASNAPPSMPQSRRFLTKSLLPKARRHSSSIFSAPTWQRSSWLTDRMRQAWSPRSPTKGKAAR